VVVTFCLNRPVEITLSEEPFGGGLGCFQAQADLVIGVPANYRKESASQDWAR